MEVSYDMQKSKALYVGLCHKIGSPTEVKIRREVMDTVEVMDKPIGVMRGFKKTKSGSKREGFRMKTSDDDWMFWSPEHKVICDPSQITLYRIPQHTVILMKSVDLPPGFTKLILMSKSNDPKVKASCKEIKKEVYISSTSFRNNHLRFLQNRDISTASSTPHGPCSTFVYAKVRETDIAFCFRSHHWPKIALHWKNRCSEIDWPPADVVSKIVRSGFHVVPIGSTPENELEWRISFSQAELRLVYSMNHCQFLCYGMLKIFLKEVINFQNNTPVLCSYFIKTLVFWAIQTYASWTWTPENLLSCFWQCFKYFIHWVRFGYCPNFFIPENNMFRLKITGSVQKDIYTRLVELYEMGTSCLLLSKTLKSCLSITDLNRALRISTNERSIISHTDLDVKLFEELRKSTLSIYCIEEFEVHMSQTEIVSRRSLTPYQTAALQCMTSDVSRNIALFIQSHIYPKKCSNKSYYSAYKVVLVMISLSCRIGYVSNILYLAMYLYRSCRYEDSLRCLQKVQERISLSYMIYKGRVNVHAYRDCMEGVSLENKIKRALVKDIILKSEYTYIDELILEQKTSKKNGEPVINIPPLVVLHMLFILNHHRLGDTVRSQQSIRDLQTLLLHDNGVYIPYSLRDISWQILGICQQICGDYFGCLESYKYSLQEKPFHMIKAATLIRKKYLLVERCNSYIDAVVFFLNIQHGRRQVSRKRGTRMITPPMS